VDEDEGGFRSDMAISVGVEGLAEDVDRELDGARSCGRAARRVEHHEVDGMIPYTVNEIRRNWATATAPRPSRRHTRAWSNWRRRRQLHALRCYYQRRLKDHERRLEY
jgi:hypothetical protein